MVLVRKVRLHEKVGHEFKIERVTFVAADKVLPEGLRGIRRRVRC